MILSTLDCYQSVFKRFPAAACLVDLSNFSFFSTNMAFESELGYVPGEFKISSFFDILDGESSKQTCKRVFNEADLTEVEFTLLGKVSSTFFILIICIVLTFSVNNRFNFKCRFIPIDSSVALLTGELNHCKIARVESVDIGLTELSTVNTSCLSEYNSSESVLSADTFPFSRIGLIDLFQNAAIGVHCTGGMIVLKLLLFLSVYMVSICS